MTGKELLAYAEARTGRGDDCGALARMVVETLAILQADAAKSERRAIAFGDIVGQQTMAMRAALVAWQREDAAAGMKWIANTLCGPGHLPSEEAIALGAQALFDKEMDEHEAFRAAHPAP